MDENNKNEIMRIMTEMECYPADFDKKDASLDRYTKLPLAGLSSMGVAFKPLVAAIQNVANPAGGGSGLYWVDTKGSKMFSFKNGSGYLGSLKTPSGTVGGGQASLNPLICDPTMLFMAAALMSINKKLDSIQETQKEIIEFLVQKEKSKLRGNLNFLADVLKNYQHNWDNEMYKNNNHIKVLDIRQESEQSILFYREQIDKRIKKQSFFHSDKYVQEKITQIHSEFKEYQLALYLFAFSSFLEVMLLENFESSYLDGVVCKIEDYSNNYCELYCKCYDQIEGYSKSSVQSQLLSGLASVNRVVGGTASKIPIVSKSQIDETLIKTGDRLDKYNVSRTETTMEQLAEIQLSAIHPFIENINVVNALHNKPMELLIDGENIYLGLPEVA